MSEIHDSAFHQLWKRGYKHLLPIVPPTATISPNSKIPDKARGKTVGRLNYENTWGGFDWMRHTTTESDLTEWAESGAGVGLRCVDVCAVDIDVLDEDLAAAVQRIALDTLGKSTCRTGRPPKRLLVYRTPESLRPRQLFFQDENNDEHLIEILGNTKQFVVEGVHPGTEKPYSWQPKSLTDLNIERLTAVTEADVDTFIEAVREALELVHDCSGFKASRSGSNAADREEVSQDKLRAPTTEHLADVVAAIPNDGQFERRDEYIRFGCAIKAAGADEPEAALAIFTDWCLRWEDGDNDIETIESDWRRMKPPFEIGYHWLTDIARGYGWDDGTAAEFGEIETLEEREVPEADEENQDDGTWWRRYVYVNDIKRFIDTQTQQRLDKEQFRDLHPGIKTEDGDAVQTFLSHRDRARFADILTYRPGTTAVMMKEANGLKAYNDWAPGPLDAGLWDGIEANIRLEDTPWYALLCHLIPDDRERDILVYWLADRIQRPHVKANWHPLIGGDQGIGKDTILEPVIHALGRNCRTVSASELESEFNWWAEGVQMVIIQEMHSFEKQAVQNRMKNYLASPPDLLNINNKNMRQYAIPNLLSVVMMTNHRDAYALEKSDRRVFVLWSDAAPWEEERYSDLYQWYNQGGTKIIPKLLKELDLGEFHTQGRAPTTQAKRDMQAASSGPIEGTLRAGIEDGAGPLSRDLVSVPEVLDWLKRELGHKGNVSPAKLVPILRDVGCASLGRVRVPGLGRPSLYAVRRTDTYRQMWEEDPMKVSKRLSAMLEDDGLADFEGDEQKKGA